MGWGRALAVGAALFCAGLALYTTLVAVEVNMGPRWPTIQWFIAAAVLAMALA